jgi:hypothetical protein
MKLHSASNVPIKHFIQLMILNILLYFTAMVMASNTLEEGIRQRVTLFCLPKNNLRAVF